MSEPLTGLVKKLDKQLNDTMTAQGRKDRFGVFVILLAGNGPQQQLKDLVAKEGLKQVVLSTFQNNAGPPRYKVAKDAHLTVAVYKNKDTVSANFVMDKGGLSKKKAEAIIEAVTKVLPQK